MLPTNKHVFLIFTVLVINTALVFTLAGCTNTSTNKVLGYGAVGVTNTAELITRECGNTVPNGPCLSTSRITTAEKQEFKTRLQAAQNALNEAARFSRQGMDAAGSDALAKADAILAALELILTQRGIAP